MACWRPEGHASCVQQGEVKGLTLPECPQSPRLLPLGPLFPSQHFGMREALSKPPLPGPVSWSAPWAPHPRAPAETSALLDLSAHSPLT